MPWPPRVSLSCVRVSRKTTSVASSVVAGPALMAVPRLPSIVARVRIAVALWSSCRPNPDAPVRASA
jgi:hypothetical protein